MCVLHDRIKIDGRPFHFFLQFLIACVHWVFPTFRFQWLADEIRHNLPIELNFLCEAQNQERFTVMFKHLGFIKVSYLLQMKEAVSGDTGSRLHRLTGT